MNIDIKDFNSSKKASYVKSISSAEELIIKFPLSSFGTSSSRIDLINDLIDVSWCCEKTAQHVNVISSGFIPRDKFYLDFQIICTALNPEPLIEILSNSCSMLGCDDISEDERIEFMETSFEYEDELANLDFTFPELINDYWANLINGAYWEIAGEYESEEDFFRDTYRKHPEHKFGFWKSAQSKSFKSPVYLSTESWIIPDRTNLKLALKNYSGQYSDFEIDEAEKIEINGRTILLTNNTAVYFNQFKELDNAVNCAQKVLAKKFIKTKDIPSLSIGQENLFGDPVKTNHRKTVIKHKLDPKLLSFKVSEIGSLVIASYKGFNHLFFGSTALAFEEIKELNSHLYPAYSKTQSLIEKSISNKCRWEELTDDSFEELCYDLLYCHPKFDSSTIQKMGKSKSRDGGRDIVIKSKRTPASDPQLYIFQCKFFSESTSMSASKIPNAGNVIMQYGAKGYGVFTSTVIDATLYDLLEGFSRHSGIDTSETWSKYELERYLNRHLHIKNKYFKKHSAE